MPAGHTISSHCLFLLVLQDDLVVHPYYSIIHAIKLAAVTSLLDYEVLTIIY
jgi:hypothetical protein